MTPISIVITKHFTANTTAEGLWNLDAQDRTYSALGNVTYNLSGGKDYSNSGGMTATLGDLFTTSLKANSSHMTLYFE